MDRLLVEVYIPMIDRSYDLELSPDMNVKSAANCIFRTICEYEFIQVQNDSCMLCDKGSKRVLNGSLSLRQCKIKDGAKLLLI